MALPRSVSLSETSVTQTIDLTKYFGDAIALRPDIAASIGQDIIDFILDRTAKSKDIDGKGFTKYSESYVDSDEFAIYGKTKKVNMELTGDMLSDLNIVDQSPTSITIGFEDEDNNAKAYGHMTGMRGHKFLDGKVPKRQFFGVKSDDIQSIADQYREEVVSGELASNEVTELLNQSSTPEQAGQAIESNSLLEFFLGSEE